MAKKQTKIRDYRDIERILDRNDIPHRNCDGSHRVAVLPDGHKLVYHNHHEYGAGLACKFTKILIAAGLLAFLLMCAYTGFAVALGQVAVVYTP